MLTVSCPTNSCWEFVIYVLVAARKLHPLDVAGAYRALIDKAANKADKQALGFGDTVVQMFKDRVNVLKADVKRRDEVAFLDVPVADGRIDQKLILMPYDVLLLPGDPADIGNSTINHAVLVIDNMPAGGNWETVKVSELTKYLHLHTPGGYYIGALGKVPCAGTTLTLR